MKTPSLLRFALITVVAGACTSLFASQEELLAAIQQVRNETVLTHNQLVANLKALNALVDQKSGDLRPAYLAFTAGLKDTRAAADTTSKRVAMLQADGEKHFAVWKSEVDQIKDDGIRTRALRRLDDARRNWNGAASALHEATVQFPALLGYLSDIEKALSYDLTTEGVKSVRGAARSANESFGTIQELTQKAVANLEEMAAAMSSMVKAP